MGKKKFIDKKKSATYQILARDTSDPNYSDSPSGDRVFVRVDNNYAYSVDTFFDEHNDAVSGDDRFADAPDDYDEEDDDGEKQVRAPPPCAAAGLPDHVRREILELGFPDDGYNYLTHLREIKNNGGGAVYYHNSKAKLDQLPRDVKAYDASRVEISDLNDDSNEKSIYSVASRTVGVRIQKAVDPEVVALLDDSDLSRFGSDDEDLEEDFVVKANLPDELEDIDLNKKLNLVENAEVNLKEIDQSKASHSQDNVVDFVEASEFRNHQLIAGEYHSDDKPRARRLLDEQFDMLEQQEYGTDGDNDYDNFMAEDDEHHESLAEKLNHALKNRTTEDLELNSEYKVPADLLHNKEKPENAEMVDSAAEIIRKCMEYAEKYENEDPDEDFMVVEESSDESEVWDCETIVSTYSNLDNHPGKIEAPEVRRKKKLAETVSEALNASSHVISLKGKAKLPVDYLPQSKKYDVENVKDVTASGKESQKRKQHGQESKEEKKERKTAVKEERREARRVKKEMKELYKCEAQRAQRVAAFTGPSSIHLM
ncbi:uncharacterized protein LOC130786568 [Actinidia eriantha]|uniref:uncharacterized protein LOC130786568 n=1 Tax=Actinidia eriantha TaxID=165200 RepID=UPI0025854B54|nr:uncharacterized protein LOC130786568 [Actinidia eriantha]XP_057502850.1 uncharacterized protein LOC130786568 [Actinidia eriantha]